MEMSILLHDHVVTFRYSLTNSAAQAFQEERRTPAAQTQRLLPFRMLTIHVSCYLSTRGVITCYGTGGPKSVWEKLSPCLAYLFYFLFLFFRSLCYSMTWRFWHLCSSIARYTYSMYGPSVQLVLSFCISNVLYRVSVALDMGLVSARGSPGTQLLSP